MKSIDAWIHVVAIITLSVLAFFTPILVLVWLMGMIAAGGRFGLRSGQTGFLVFMSITIALNALLLAMTSPGAGASWTLGPVTFGYDGLVRGAVGGLRIVAITGVNLAWLQEAPVAAVIQGLRLPRGVTVFLAAVLIAVQDIGRDFARMVDGRRMTGDWPTTRWGHVRASASLVAPLMVASVGRARIRRDALQVARISVSGRFVPLVAVTALSLAGRFALVAVPNVSLVHVVVFVAGLVFGPTVAVGAALLAMGISDLFLSGLVPAAFVNAPAMAVVGLLGGMLRRIDFSGAAGRVLAAAMGVFATLLFSITADVGEWLLVPEFRGDVVFLQVRLATGLAFNALPAVVHAVLFASVCGPVQRAFRQRRVPEGRPPSPTPATGLP